MFNTLVNDRFYLGRSPCVMPRDPELIKEITVKDFDSFTDRVVSDHMIIWWAIISYTAAYYTVMLLLLCIAISVSTWSIRTKRVASVQWRWLERYATQPNSSFLCIQNETGMNLRTWYLLRHWSHSLADHPTVYWLCTLKTFSQNSCIAYTVYMHTAGHIWCFR